MTNQVPSKRKSTVPSHWRWIVRLATGAASVILLLTLLLVRADSIPPLTKSAALYGQWLTVIGLILMAFAESSWAKKTAKSEDFTRLLAHAFLIVGAVCIVFTTST